MHNAIAPRWRKMLRDAGLHKARTSLVIAAVVLGMIAAGALLDAWALVRRVTLETYAATHPASASLLVDDAVDGAMLARLRALPELAAVRVHGHASAAIQIEGTRYTAELFALPDFAAREIAAVSAEHGAWPPHDGEISIEKSSLAFAGAAIGQNVEIQLGQRTRTLRVTGVAHDVGLPPGWMDHVVYGFVTPATLAALGAKPTLNEVQFVVRDPTLDRDATRRIAARVKAVLEKHGVRVAHVDVPVPGQHPHAAQMDSLMFTQGAFGVLTLLVVSFLIVNLMTAMLAGQTREIGVMKALGGSPRQIGLLYLAFALLIGTFASALALPAALAIARPYAALKAEMLNFSIEGFAIPWWAIAIQLGVGCLLPVLAAAWPVARACRMPVAVALRHSGIATDDGAYLKRHFSLPGVSRPLLLSIGNAFRRRQRTLLTLLALAAGGAVYVGADSLRVAVLDSVDRMFATQRYDVMLRLADAYPPARIEAAAAHVDNVERTQALLGDKTVVVHADGTTSDAFPLLGIPPDTPLFRPAIERGRWLAANDANVLVVSQRLLRDEPQLQPGRDVMLRIGTATSTWHIVGADQTIAQTVAYAPFTTLASVRGDDKANLLAVALRSGDAAAKLDTIMRLRGAFEQQDLHIAGSQLLSESRRSVEDHLLMVWQFLAAMAWVMIAVGGMGLASTMSVAVLERRREIGVLRAIGARHGAIRRMIQIEGLVIVVLAWLVALLLSTPISAVLADVFGRIMFPVPVRLIPGAAAALSWLVLSMLGSFIACAWASRGALRVSTASALNYE